MITNIKSSKPKCIWKSKNILGEGTLWVKEHNSLYFVDIFKQKIFILNIKNKRKKIINLNKRIGFLAHIKNNIFILGLQGELRIVDLKSKKTLKSIFVEKNLPNNRINDGKTDPKGRLWFGTMDNLERSITKGSLYCLDKKLKIHKVDKDYMITNGPAFLDSNNFYHTDSRRKKIFKIKINKDFEIIKKKIFVEFNSKEGSPDGMTLDHKKNLWVCHYHGASISVFDLNGKRIHKILFPAKNITNCIFGGKKNSELFVSTATKSMKESELKEYKHSGSLFSLKTNVKGNFSQPFKIKI